MENSHSLLCQSAQLHWDESSSWEMEEAEPKLWIGPPIWWTVEYGGLMGGLSWILSHITTVYFLSADQSRTTLHSLIIFCSPLLHIYFVFCSCMYCSEHMYTCMCVCLPHTPMHYHICEMQCSEEHNVYMYVPPTLSNNLCHPLSSPAPFIRSSMDTHFWHLVQFE